jgi:aspartyl-tRNA(Asn)/glutamyl-tRNA(Gln) amidotransferase subunit C
MEKKDIVHLASLARIRISDEEAEALREDVDSVLSYVSAVNDIAADASLTKKVGVVHNVFREDKTTNEPDQYTEALLSEAPKVKGRHLMVKKILQMD